MKNVKAKAIRYGEKRPPEPTETLLDIVAEAILKSTGLKGRARRKLRSELFETQSDAYIQNLQRMFNDVVDGGFRGLVTAIRVCYCLKNPH